ncbi:MAG: GNAT family N-acetyltransferase [bacterium]
MGKVEVGYRWLARGGQVLDYSALHDDPSLAELAKVLTDREMRLDVMCTAGGGASWVVARDYSHPPVGKIVGMGMLVPLRKSVGFVGHADDIVVLESYRGKELGIARNIMMRIEEEARRLSMKYVELTSKPDRVPANKLYLSCGYKLMADAVPESTIPGGSKISGTGGTNLYRLYL